MFPPGPWVTFIMQITLDWRALLQNNRNKLLTELLVLTEGEWKCNLISALIAFEVTFIHITKHCLRSRIDGDTSHCLSLRETGQERDLNNDNIWTMVRYFNQEKIPFFRLTQNIFRKFYFITRSDQTVALCIKAQTTLDLISNISKQLNILLGL